MAKLVPVDRERHAGKGWRQPTGYGFAATQAVTPLMGAEFAKAAVAIEKALDETIAAPALRTRDLGGPLGTKAFTARVVAALKGEG